MVKQVEIVAHNDRWAQQYQRIAGRIRGAYGGFLRIDHIGSTAVAGLSAKDVIDIQITVQDLENSDWLDALIAHGFQHVPRITHDVLVGYPPDHPELRKMFLREPADSRRCHIHVRANGRLNQRYALLFRDYLCTHPEVAASYAVLKQRLAALYPDDIDGYLRIKDPVMDLIYNAAESWAVATQWQVD